MPDDLGLNSGDDTGNNRDSRDCNPKNDDRTNSNGNNNTNNTNHINISKEQKESPTRHLSQIVPSSSTSDRLETLKKNVQRSVQQSGPSGTLY